MTPDEALRIIRDGQREVDAELERLRTELRDARKRVARAQWTAKNFDTETEALCGEFKCPEFVEAVATYIEHDGTFGTAYVQAQNLRDLRKEASDG